MVLAQLRLRITSAILMSLSWVQTHLHTKVRKMSLRWDCTLWSLVQSRSAFGSKNLTAPTTFYAGGVYKLELFLPEDYPMAAPKVGDLVGYSEIINALFLRC